MGITLGTGVCGLWLGLLAGCQSGAEPGSGSGTDGVKSPGTAQAAVAGSPAEADMCPEHGVLEAVCTLCNPKLAPIFKAKGDWCAEHGLPESFCPTCHPELHGRPRVDVAADQAPADGMRVQFADPEIAGRIGLETASVVAAHEQATITATARIVADAAKTAQVNVRAPGVIRSFTVDLGTVVRPGTPLAVIESAAAAEDQARLRSAHARVQTAKAGYERETELFARGISSLRETQEAERELEEAQAEVEAAEAAVGMVGGATGGRAGAYTLVAPIGGVITARSFSVGAMVDAEETIVEILDTSSLWAEIDVPESQAARVAVGDPVALEIDGISGGRIEGALHYVAPVVDPRTRTVKCRAALDNRDGRLRANMFARAWISVRIGAGAVLVPRAAVQDANGVQLVFIPRAADQFETRRVRTQPSDGDLVAVLEGLHPGESVVTTGSFLLKTETLKESIGAGCCDIETPR
ncbi:MAG: efflux RND transporter periplasmic adaptor subunit [Candidatus Eisenbacteria bacterium]|nr:efflux RND transporter periplasmic adaptor subunit [Candidatus Eisenbacteria bacterium]